MNLYEAIFVRKSVRNYCFDTLPPQTLDKIWEHYKEMPALFSGIGVDMAILDNRKGQERMLSMFSVKAPYYMAFYSEESERYLMNVGYIMEQMVLYLCSIGLGTCFIGSNRVKKAELEKNGKRLVGIVAFGKSHGSHTRRQSEAKRLPLEDLCAERDSEGVEVNTDDLGQPRTTSCGFVPASQVRSYARSDDGDGGKAAGSARRAKIG